jgi:hypothetical protein
MSRHTSDHHSKPVTTWVSTRTGCPVASQRPEEQGLRPAPLNATPPRHTKRLST